jgi:hypothetical protein
MEKHLSIIYFCVWGEWGARVCAFGRVALLTPHATRCHVVIYGLYASTTFFDMVMNDKILGKRLLNIKFVLIVSPASSEAHLILRRI